MTVKEAEQRGMRRSPAADGGAVSSGGYGKLWASAHARLGASVKEAVRCVCHRCGAHSYRAIGVNGGRDQCSVCGDYDLQPLESAA